VPRTNAARRHLLASLDRALAGARRRVEWARQDSTDTDLAIDAILTRPEAGELRDPTGFVRFLRECFGRLTFSVREVRADDDRGDPAALRFQTLLDHLATGVAAIDQRDAVRIGRIADDLLARTDPFERPTWVADVGIHARIASSFGRKGRLLSATARVMAADRAIEVGTAYGMSALFLAAAMRDGGTLVTLERSEPQLSIARDILQREHGDAVAVLGGISTELREAVRERVSPAGLLFHDGEHSRRAYVEDFNAFESSLGSGAVVLYDDVDWALAGGASDTYAGWREVAAHARVRRAVELDREFGLLMLA
jgi:predicted O-methyltransferase YrrM